MITSHLNGAWIYGKGGCHLLVADDEPLLLATRTWSIYLALHFLDFVDIVAHVRFIIELSRLHGLPDLLAHSLRRHAQPKQDVLVVIFTTAHFVHAGLLSLAVSPLVLRHQAWT